MQFINQRFFVRCYATYRYQPTSALISSVDEQRRSFQTWLNTQTAAAVMTQKNGYIYVLDANVLYAAALRKGLLAIYIINTANQ